MTNSRSQQLNLQSTAATPTQSRSSTPNPDYQLHHSPPSVSPNHTSSPGGQTSQSRPRSRFSFQSLKNWRPSRWGSSSVSSTASPSPVEASSQASFPFNLSPYPVSSDRVVSADLYRMCCNTSDTATYRKLLEGPRFFPRKQDLELCSTRIQLGRPLGERDGQRGTRRFHAASQAWSWLCERRKQLADEQQFFYWNEPNVEWGVLQNVFSSLTMSPRRVVGPSSSRRNREPSAGRPHTTSTSIYRENLLSIVDAADGRRSLRAPPVFIPQTDLGFNGEFLQKDGEAERRISFFAQSLTTAIPESIPVDAMPTFAVLIPHSEKVFFSLRPRTPADTDLQSVVEEKDRLCR